MDFHLRQLQRQYIQAQIGFSEYCRALVIAGEITPTADIDLFAQQLGRWYVVEPLFETPSDPPPTSVSLNLLWSIYKLIFREHPAWTWSDAITQATFESLNLHRKLILIERHYQLPIADVLPYYVIRGKGLYWLDTPPDTPSVGEVLHETINDLAGYLSGRFNVPPWAQMENLEEQAVQEIHQLWNALREYNLLPSE